MEFKIEKILEYSDLFPHEVQVDVPAVLKKYSRDKLIKAVNVLGMNYGNAFMPDTTIFSKISVWRVDELNERFQRYAPHLRNSRICYCTHRTVLELLRYVFSIPQNEYKDDGDEADFEYDLFIVLLQLNEDLMAFAGKDDDKTLPTLMFFLNYVLNDIVKADWKSVLRTQFLYFSKLKEFLNEEGNKELCGSLCEKIGVNSLDEYLQTILGLVVIYVSEQEKHKKGCPCFCISDNEHILSKSVCDYLSLNITDSYSYTSEYFDDRQNNIDYRVFRSHPLIKYDETHYYIYNLPILCERLYNGLFFDLKPLYDKGNFFQFYNSKFIEQYLFQHVMLECIGRKTTMSYPTVGDIGKSELSNQPDFYIRENDSIILFECKGIKLNGHLKDKSDLSDMVAELQNKLYLSTQNSKRRIKKEKSETVGVTQLIRQMNLIEDDKFVGDKDIPNAVSYYPVLVIEDPKIVQPGLMALVNSWYQPLLKQELAETYSHPVIVLSIDVLFSYKDVFLKYGFSNVLDKFFNLHMRKGKCGVDWTLDELADFNCFIKENYKVGSSALRYARNMLKSVTKSIDKEI